VVYFLDFLLCVPKIFQTEETILNSLFLYSGSLLIRNKYVSHEHGNKINQMIYDILILIIGVISYS